MILNVSLTVDFWLSKSFFVSSDCREVSVICLFVHRCGVIALIFVRV